jgi:hypothetical protein
VFGYSGKFRDVVSVIIASSSSARSIHWSPGSERRGLRRGCSLVLVFVIAALAFAALVLLMVPPLIAQSLHLIEGP